jgi:ribose transport system permease protein
MSAATPTVQAPTPASGLRARLPALIRIYGIIATLVLLLIVVTAGNPAFLSIHNIFNMLSEWAPAGIMAVGMTFVILTGGFDLSIASGYSLCAVVAAYVGQTQAPLIAFAAAVLRLGWQTACSSRSCASIRSSPRSAPVSLSPGSRS